ncbi:alpha/beta hydrolase [Rhizosphaericola mali]|nr:alpha/beta hydrolase [Rhizosphaericola mali]
MNLKIYWPIFLVMLDTICFAQTHVPDTTFTIYSVFKKEVKKRPYIEIAYASDTINISTKRGVVYSKTSDRNLYLDITIPKKSSRKKRPVVLFVFGGGWSSGNRSQNIPLAQEMAKNDIIGITVDYRLSTEALYPIAVYDLKNAIRWIKSNEKKYAIDTNKIAICGFSAGGQLAALVSTTGNLPLFEKEKINNYSSNVQALIDVDGVLSFVHPESQEKGSDTSHSSAAAKWLGYSYSENKKLWDQASPLTYASSQSVPTLFINSSIPRFHGGRDDFINILEQNKIKTETIEIPDTPHPFWLFHPWFDQVSKTIVVFINQTFQ